MHRSTKIATCCYCGTRAALVLGEDRHELSCSACGAPLHELKAMPLKETRRQPAGDRRPAASARKPTRKRKPARKPAHRPEDVGRGRRTQPPRRRKTRRRKVLKKIAEEVLDAIEDIFD